MRTPCRTTRPILAATTAAMLALAGCTTEDALQPTPTQAQAKARVEQLARQAGSALPGGASLEYHDGSNESACDDPTDDGPAGRIFIDHRYTVVPPADDGWRPDQVIPTLVRFWQEQKYQLHDDRRTDPDPNYVVETPDGYYVGIWGYDRGDHLDFTVNLSSPCIWQNGTPDPQ
ncbi:hypothetical protein [Mangrovihabitans endophyticus]|uniref:Lipoprotein n=1 Tax=Mangrovihabitans endophyticus TaxID=1751298 RepID=A0A8J3BZF3_9ACTN|nr:hypothetical protein [Mangrovihabitans endophyticus]GGK96565.1 hypothetical protein GCM10012284_33470 [Mangrovihabitans endophyticus]